MDDDWTVREDDGVALADVRSYTRMRDGKPEQVRNYTRMGWWIPHPDWVNGQQRWITAGEAAWNERSSAARAEDASRRASEAADDTTRTARAAERGTAADVSPHLGMEGRPAHNYALPDPERLIDAKARTAKNPADHPFFKRNPVSAANVVKIYKQATPAEKNQGLRWYADAHRLAWALGGGDAELGAKMLSAYSSRTGWPLNMFNAARSLAEGRALGPGDGVIMGQHRKAGEAILGGADIDTAFPSPKTNAFARLIALGEDHPDDELGQVVIDRHALSVAAGRRLTKEDVEGKGEFHSPIAQPRMYEHVADQYRTGARQISDEEGQEISPAQLQAIGWLVQQRLNQEEDLASGSGGKGLVTAMKNHWAAWEAYAKEHGIRTELGTTAPAALAIGKGEVPAGTRSVDPVEFQAIAGRGRDLLNAMEADRQPVTGLVSNWGELKDSAWQEMLKPDGAVTIDPRTGEPLPSDADKYALSIKPPGLGAVSVPENATQEQFGAAMDEALVKFRPVLEQAGHYLAVYHDANSHRVDVDPVAVAGSQADAEALAAYTHNVGGAFHFKSGTVVHPPFTELRQVELAVLHPGDEGLPLGRGEVQLRPLRETAVADADRRVVLCLRLHAVSVVGAVRGLGPLRFHAVAVGDAVRRLGPLRFHAVAVVGAER